MRQRSGTHSHMAVRLQKRPSHHRLRALVKLFERHNLAEHRVVQLARQVVAAAVPIMAVVHAKVRRRGLRTPATPSHVARRTMHSAQRTITPPTLQTPRTAVARSSIAARTPIRSALP
jgi:hypothetical protein